jgi:TolB-like protein
VDIDRSVTATTGQKINYFIIIALIVVVLFQQFAPSLKKMTSFAADRDSIGIAVLPFADLSATRDQEYLGDGVAEEILNVLAAVQGLKVTSRTSAFAFKGQNLPIPEIARILGVTHIVEGSVRKQADQVRITAQLINVEDDSHLWSDTFDSDLSNIFSMQDEIAAQISRALSSHFDLALPEASRDTPDWNIGAYELLLRAQQMVRAREDDSYEDVITLLDTALKIEPSFADAWAEKAVALGLLAYNKGLDPDLAGESFATYDEAWLAARRATEIEPNHPLGLAVLGLVRLNQLRWTDGRVLLERAVQVQNPNDYAFLWLGILQIMTGDNSGALNTLDAGLERSPTAPNLIRIRTNLLAMQGRWQEIWENRDVAAATRMPVTLQAQWLAGLMLGEISLDDLSAHLEGEIQTSPDETAFIIATLKTMLEDPEAIDVDALAAEFENYEVASSMLVSLNPTFSLPEVVRTAPTIPDRPNTMSLYHFWTDGFAEFRSSDAGHQLIADLRLPAYWDVYGWPDSCRPVGIADFNCD